MLELINRKVEGEDITIAPTAEPEHKIIDIMEALKASLAAGNARKPAQQAETPADKKAAKSKPVAKKRAAAK
jgi:non-homologous end joining protein Ku